MGAISFKQGEPMYGRTIITALCSVALLSGCGKRNFTEFKSEDAGFKIQFPGSPKEKTQRAGAIDMTMYVVEESNGAYFATYANMPIPKNESDAQIQKRLDGSVQGMVGNVSANITSQSRIRLDGKYPGREVEADIPSKKGTLRARVYLVGNRLYQIMVIGSRSWTKSSDSRKFFDSFQLTK